MDCAEYVYKLTRSFPKGEMYGLTSQIRRAAVSVPSNIAEGKMLSPKAFSRHLGISLGSLAELETQLELARRVGYLSSDCWKPLEQRLLELARKLNSLRQTVIRDCRRKPTANS